jgi:uncharacterized oxidoreductase
MILMMGNQFKYQGFFFYNLGKNLRGGLWMNTSGNTILITGGATGIGFAIAEQFVQKGNNVVICGRREQKLQEAKQKIPGIQTRVCDVSKELERISLFEWVTSEFPRLNILINNAGIQRDVDFMNIEEDWSYLRDEITINVEAPMHLSALFIPHLAEKENPAIVNVSSGLAFTPMSIFPIYCATKAAIHSFSMTLRHQLVKANIALYEVIPPAVDSELNYEGRKKRGALETGVTSREFATAVMQGLESGKTEIGYGNAEMGRTASRQQLDEIFRRMNRL